MDDERMNDPQAMLPGEDERRAAERVRALPRAQADPEFRARLAADFASGAIERAPAAARVHRLPWHRREMTRWTLAAAAAAVLVAAALALNQGPDWRVVSARGRGLASIDGREIALGDANFGRLLRPGALLALPEGGELTLEAGDVMMLAVDPGSVVTLPTTPGRWFGRRVRARVDSGEMRVTTGAAFHGAVLALLTPQAQVQVTGTTLAVICESAGTCVCVLEGRVRVGPLGAAMADIPGGMRGYVYADGTPMAREVMRADEVVKLGALREARAARPGARPR